MSTVPPVMTHHQAIAEAKRRWGHWAQVYVDRDEICNVGRLDCLGRGLLHPHGKGASWKAAFENAREPALRLPAWAIWFAPIVATSLLGAVIMWMQRAA